MSQEDFFGFLLDGDAPSLARQRQVPEQDEPEPVIERAHFPEPAPIPKAKPQPKRQLFHAIMETKAAEPEPAPRAPVPTGGFYTSPTYSLSPFDCGAGFVAHVTDPEEFAMEMFEHRALNSRWRIEGEREGVSFVNEFELAKGHWNLTAKRRGKWIVPPLVTPVGGGWHDRGRGGGAHRGRGGFADRGRGRGRGGAAGM